MTNQITIFHQFVHGANNCDGADIVELGQFGFGIKLIAVLKFSRDNLLTQFILNQLIFGDLLKETPFFLYDFYVPNVIILNIFKKTKNL